MELPAVRVTGQLAYSGNVRPWEFYLLDHPTLPLTLRFAVGGVGQSFPFEAEVTREIVKIDFPDPQRQVSVVESGLTTECRAEVPGLYFDFNKATIDARSKPALQSMADLLKRHPWSVTVEGHTDNVGTDRYNQDLSQRRAAAVKDALVRDYADRRLKTLVGRIRRQTIRETNETIAGRREPPGRARAAIARSPERRSRQ